MNKSVSHYLRDYLQLTGSAKFNFLTGGADRPLSADESRDLSATLNKYMVDIVPPVPANDVFKKQLMTKDQFDAAKAGDVATYGAFADYAAFTADWKDVQKALVAALLAAADAEMAAGEALAPGLAPGSAAAASAATGSPGTGAKPPTPGSAAAASAATGSPGTGAKPLTPGSAASPAGTGSPRAATANPFTFRLRGGAASPSLLAAAIAASGVVVATSVVYIGIKNYFTSPGIEVNENFMKELFNSYNLSNGESLDTRKLLSDIVKSGVPYSADFKNSVSELVADANMLSGEYTRSGGTDADFKNSLSSFVTDLNMDFGDLNRNSFIPS